LRRSEPVQELIAMADETLPAEATRPQRTAEPRQAPLTPFKVFKPGQGVHVRWGTAIGAGVILLAGARFLHEWLRLPFPDNLVMRTLIPVAVLAAGAYLIFWLVGQRPGTVDFMIATEGEMKKVNWSSRREVLGATRVVIFTVLVLGVLLFIVDALFMLLFSAIGVLKIPVWQVWFGGAGGEGAS
jgi:preprotein translocase subunit SecE